MEGSSPRRRRHSEELRARVLEACSQPGASIARVALENGLNANLVHKWRQRAAGAERAAKSVVPVAEFVSLPILPAAEHTPAEDIRISIRRGGTTLDIQWPVSGAQACGQWLCARHLHRGGFVWASAQEGASVALTAEQLKALVVGLPWQRLKDAAAIRLY